MRVKKIILAVRQLSERENAVAMMSHTVRIDATRRQLIEYLMKKLQKVKKSRHVLCCFADYIYGQKKSPVSFARRFCRPLKPGGLAPTSP